MTNIGLYIRSARRDKGYRNVAEFSKASNISPSRLLMFEQNKRLPSISEVDQICFALSIPIESLIKLCDLDAELNLEKKKIHAILEPYFKKIEQLTWKTLD